MLVKTIQGIEMGRGPINTRRKKISSQGVKVSQEVK